MTSAELRHNLTSVSTYRPLTAGLNLYHSFEIADSALDPAEMQNLSLTSLREADFGTQLELEISCAIGRFRVASDRLARFPFVSNLLTQLREVCRIAVQLLMAMT
ncbi:hypothetical protein FRC08_015944 [Ceratobasidium sp. 394]|nr:hypothetical protein FRC08_015944 [Ceratobasidium sp. 394]